MQAYKPESRSGKKLRIAFVEDNFARWESFARHSWLSGEEAKKLEEYALTRWDSYIDTYAEFLMDNGHECCKYVPSIYAERAETFTHHLGHKVTRVPTMGNKKSGLSNAVSFNLNLKRLFAKNPPAVIHYNTYYSAYFLSAGIHKPQSAIVGQYSGGEPPPSTASVTTRAKWLVSVKLALGQADGILVGDASRIERDQAKLLRHYYGVKGNKIFTCPVVVYDEKVFYQRSPKASSERVGFDGAICNILVVSGMTKASSKTELTKNPLYFIEVLGELSKSAKRWHAHFVGFGPAFLDAKKKVQELGLEDVVSFLGLVDHDQLPFYYSASSLVAYPLPAYDLESGIAVNEAFACRRPVVCFKRESKLETSQRGGYLLDSEAVKAADELGKIISDPAALEKKGEEGYEMSQRFRLDVVGRRLMGIYDALVR